MPGDDLHRFPNLRHLYDYMWKQPGKKMLFMGGDYGQRNEWKHDTILDWHLLHCPPHHGLQRWVRDVNTLYRGEPALQVHDCDRVGLEWIVCNDCEFFFFKQKTAYEMEL